MLIIYAYSQCHFCHMEIRIFAVRASAPYLYNNNYYHLFDINNMVFDVVEAIKSQIYTENSQISIYMRTQMRGTAHICE